MSSLHERSVCCCCFCDAMGEILVSFGTVLFADRNVHDPWRPGSTYICRNRTLLRDIAGARSRLWRRFRCIQVCKRESLTCGGRACVSLMPCPKGPAVQALSGPQTWAATSRHPLDSSPEL